MYNTNRNSQKRSNDKRRRECYFEERDEIVKIVNERGSISNQELVKMFGASESTIRRDITTLANDNRVIRAWRCNVGCIGRRNGRFGSQCKTYSKTVMKKSKSSKYAASLINDGDLVYIDAGTTTEYMIEYITAKDVTFCYKRFISRSRSCEKRL